MLDVLPMQLFIAESIAHARAAPFGATLADAKVPAETPAFRPWTMHHAKREIATGGRTNDFMV